MTTRGAFTIALALVALEGCGRAPESMMLPPQYVMPAGEDPPVPPPDPNRILLAMSDPDIKGFILQDVDRDRDEVEWRFTGAHPKFRFPRVAPEKLDLYLRFFAHEGLFKVRGAAVVAVSLNGRPLEPIRLSAAGMVEERRPVPAALLSGPGPIEISLDIDPVWGVEKYGILLHTIGFERRAP